MLSRRVLIIEDDADAAGVLEAYLRRENYDVTITGDGLSGLDMAQRWKPDLILLDVMLPGLNGTEVLAGLRRKSDVPVIMVTAMGDTPDRIGALRYGADDYVVKPYHPGEVVARVQAVLRRSSKKETALANAGGGCRRHCGVRGQRRRRACDARSYANGILASGNAAALGCAPVLPPVFTGTLFAGKRGAGARGGHPYL